MPTTADLRARIGCFLRAGTGLSRAAANVRPGDQRLHEAEDALGTWDVLLREWHRGSLAPLADRPVQGHINRKGEHI